MVKLVYLAGLTGDLAAAAGKLRRLFWFPTAPDMYNPFKTLQWGTLVVRWIRIHLPMQRTRV